MRWGAPRNWNRVGSRSALWRGRTGSGDASEVIGMMHPPASDLKESFSGDHSSIPFIRCRCLSCSSCPDGCSQSLGIGRFSSPDIRISSMSFFLDHRTESRHRCKHPSHRSPRNRNNPSRSPARLMIMPLDRISCSGRKAMRTASRSAGHFLTSTSIGHPSAFDKAYRVSPCALHSSTVPCS